MTHPSHTDVLICGAGAAGLTLALDLARRGIDFRVIDRAERPFQGSRGKGVQPRTMEVFEQLGIADRAAARGGLYPPLRRHAADGTWTDEPAPAGYAPTPAEPYALPWMVPQNVLEDMMRERLQELGHAVAYGTALDTFAQDADGVTVTLAGPDGASALRARYLVGADGARSTVRRLLGIDFPGKTLGVRALVADVAVTGLDRGAWHRFNDDAMDRHVALCPLAGTDLFQLQAALPPEGDVDVSAAGIGALVAARTGRADIRIDAVHWASAYRMNARLADRYRDGRVLLAGDAAHVHPPTGAQGLNTGVQDAWNLGWKLAAVLAGADDGLLDTYEEERRPVAAGVLGLSTRLLDAAKQGDLRRGRDVRQLDVAYPDSALSLAVPPARGRPATASGLVAGMRAPDAPVRGAGGQPVRLFGLFAGTHWTLIGQDADPAALAALRRPGVRVHAFGPGGDLIDDGGAFRAAYGTTPGSLVLVRPDGYLGAIADGNDREAVAAIGDFLGRTAAGPGTRS